MKNVSVPNLELKKLIYMYLVRHAGDQPDLALLSVNSFQRDLSDQNPLIRSLALRVMSSIRLPIIQPIVLMAVQKCAKVGSGSTSNPQPTPPTPAAEPTSQPHLCSFHDPRPAQDGSAHVRKTVASALPKLMPAPGSAAAAAEEEADAETASHVREEVLAVLQQLLGDMSPSVLSAAVFAFTELCPNQLALLHTHYHRMVRTHTPRPHTLGVGL